MKSYDYANRKGVEIISWERFGQMARSLAEQLAPERIEVVIGIARAGLFPATAVAAMLRREMYPVSITRRVEDKVVFERPVWRVDVPALVRGRRVAVIDEMADSGETLALVAARALERDAAKVVRVALVSHTWASPTPHITALVSDALVVFPWDREVYADGRWQMHPELADALRAQGLDASGLDNES
ncbi:MAG: phosphoribosyltransferase [Anaerolineales bacterium]